MELEGISPNKINQEKKHKYQMVSLIYEICRNKGSNRTKSITNSKNLTVEITLL